MFRKGCINFPDHVFSPSLSLSLSLWPTQEVSLALFAEHQLCFSFLMCCRVMQTKHGDPLPAEEWHTFLHTPVLANMLVGPQQQRPTHARWLTSSMWTQCQYLSTHLPIFSALWCSLCYNPPQWSAFKQADSLYSFLGEPYSPDSSSPPPGQSTALQPLGQQPGESASVVCIRVKHFHMWQ